MTSRKDYLGRECELGGLPIAEFQEQFCSKCVQPECTRSRHGKSKFDQRVTNWEERLFLNPARMDQEDSRFAAISGQKFLSLEGIQTSGSQSEWIDPNEVEKPSAIIVPKAVEQPKRQLPMMNTPFQNGAMIGGKGPPQKGPLTDPWAAPEPAKDPIVKPGTRIKLGVEKK